MCVYELLPLRYQLFNVMCDIDLFQYQKCRKWTQC